MSVGLLLVVQELLLGNGSFGQRLDQPVKHNLGLLPGPLGHVGDHDDGAELDPELGEEGRHVPRLSVELVLPVCQGEDAELAARELLPGGENVGKQQGQAAVIVQPPHVNSAASLTCLATKI